MNPEKKKTILLVEDEVIIALSEKKSLEKYGYKVIIENTGEKAIEIIKETPGIDLILMDIDLGKGIDGTKTAEIILKDNEIPVVFLSSHVEPEIVGKTEKITSYGYVVKNSGITVLDASIKMAFKLFEANKKVETAKDKLEATLDALPDLLFEVGLDGCVYDYHSPNNEILYIPAKDSIGKRIQEILPPVITNVIMSAVSEAHEKGFSSGKQFEMDVPAGKCWFEISVSRKDSSPIDPHFIILRRDITVRKQSEDSLRESEEKFRNLFNNAEVGMFRTRLDGSEALEFNDKYLSILGKTREESLGKPSSILWADPRERGEMVKTLKVEGHVENLECRLLKKDGTIINCVTSLRLYPEQGILEGSIIDITERKEMDDEIKRKNEELNAAMEELEATNEELMSTNEKLIHYQAEIIAGEKALRESEFKYRSLIEHSSDVIFCVDRNGVYQFANNTFASAFGKTPDYFIGKTYWDVYPKEYADFRQEATGRVFKTGKSESLEVVTPLPDRTLIFLAKLNPIRDDNGNVISVLVNSTDITERKKVDEELRNSESSFRSIFAKSAAGYVLTSPEGRLLKVNSAFANMLGYTINELELINFRDITHPDDIYISNESMLAQLAGKEDMDKFEKRYLHKNGNVVWTIVNTTLVRDNKNLPMYFITSIIDISERKTAEDVLHLSEKKYRLLFENMDSGFQLSEILIDENNIPYDFRFLDGNRQMKNYTGLLIEEVKGKTIRQIMPTADINMIKQYGNVALSGDPLTLEYYSLTFNKYFKINAYSPQKGQFAVIFEDITDRRQTEDKIKSLLSEKDLILKEVHHRIKNNMNTIKSLLALQADSFKDMHIVNALHEAENRIQSMMVLYDKLYQSSNFNEISIKDYFEELIDQIISNFPNSSSVTIKKYIEDFILDSKKLTPLGIIINELLTNSMKHAFADRTDGIITVSTSIIGNHVSFIIHDNGRGMPESIDMTNQTGFGLLLVEKLIEQIGGIIRIECENGVKVILEFEK